MGEIYGDIGELGLELLGTYARYRRDMGQIYGDIGEISSAPLSSAASNSTAFLARLVRVRVGVRVRVRLRLRLRVRVSSPSCSPGLGTT